MDLKPYHVEEGVLEDDAWLAGAVGAGRRLAGRLDDGLAPVEAVEGAATVRRGGYADGGLVGGVRAAAASIVSAGRKQGDRLVRPAVMDEARR